MIWNDSSECRVEQAWAEYVEAQAASQSSATAEPGLCESVGEAVGAYLAAQAGRAPVAVADVDFMIARALWAFGRPELAQDWAMTRQGGSGLAPLAEVALSEQVSLPLWRAAFASGLVRPSRSELVAGAVWVLDLAALRRHLDCVWELGIFSALDTLVDRVSFVWDRTAGHGLLGLWHTACIQPGNAGRRRNRAAWARELRDRCASRLDLMRLRRGWMAAPRTVVVDLS